MLTAELPTASLWRGKGREAALFLYKPKNASKLCTGAYMVNDMKKSIGIPVNPPEQTCDDKNCAWHGRLPVRGRTFHGTVSSSKARRTVVVEWGYTHLVSKYERYERRKSSVVAYNPSCMKARQGDEVVIAECRPLSKTKRFVVVAVPKRRVEHTEFKVAEIEDEAVKKAAAKAPKSAGAKDSASKKDDDKKDKPSTDKPVKKDNPSTDKKDKPSTDKPVKKDKPSTDKKDK